MGKAIIELWDCMGKRARVLLIIFCVAAVASIIAGIVLKEELLPVGMLILLFGVCIFMFLGKNSGIIRAC